MKFIAILILSFVFSFIFGIISEIIIEKLKMWRRRRRNESMENTPVDNLYNFDDFGDPYGYHFNGGTRSTSSAPPLPIRPIQPVVFESSHIRHNAGGQASLPALPYRRADIVTNPECFPKCPIHKCCNRRGQSQKIFWDSQRKMWRCYHGHNFLS